MLLCWRRVQLTTPKWSQYLTPTNSRVFLTSSQNFLWAFDKLVQVFYSSIRTESDCNGLELFIFVAGLIVCCIGINRKYLWQKKQESYTTVYSIISKVSKDLLRKKMRKEEHLSSRFKRVYGRDRVSAIGEGVIDLSLFGLIDIELGKPTSQADSHDSSTTPYEDVVRVHDESQGTTVMENKRRRHSIGSVVVTAHGMVPNSNTNQTLNKQRRHSFHSMDSAKSSTSNTNAGVHVGESLSQSLVISGRRHSNDSETSHNSQSSKSSRRRPSDTEYAKEHVPVLTPRTSTIDNKNTSDNLVPHFRHECTVNAFDLSYPRTHDLRCGLCVCYVCDKRASSCEEWGLSHCHAHPDLESWRQLRDEHLTHSRTSRRRPSSASSSRTTNETSRTHRLPPIIASPGADVQ
jgi:hypothetical protein